MQNINKKGLSQVISVMIIIGLSIVSVSAIYVAVKDLTNPTILLSAENCLDNQLNPPLKIIKTCYNQTSKELELTLEKSSFSEIPNALFIVYNVKQSEKYICGEDCNNCKLPSGERTYYFTQNTKPVKVSIALNEECVLETKDVIYCK